MDIVIPRDILDSCWDAAEAFGLNTSDMDAPDVVVEVLSLFINNLRNMGAIPGMATLSSEDPPVDFSELSKLIEQEIERRATPEVGWDDVQVIDASLVQKPVRTGVDLFRVDCNADFDFLLSLSPEDPIMTEPGIDEIRKRAIEIVYDDLFITDWGTPQARKLVDNLVQDHMDYMAGQPMKKNA